MRKTQETQGLLILMYSSEPVTGQLPIQNVDGKLFDFFKEHPFLVPSNVKLTTFFGEIQGKGPSLPHEAVTQFLQEQAADRSSFEEKQPTPEDLLNKFLSWHFMNVNIDSCKSWPDEAYLTYQSLVPEIRERLSQLKHEVCDSDRRPTTVWGLSSSPTNTISQLGNQLRNLESFQEKELIICWNECKKIIDNALERNPLSRSNQAKDFYQRCKQQLDISEKAAFQSVDQSGYSDVEDAESLLKPIGQILGAIEQVFGI